MAEAIPHRSYALHIPVIFHRGLLFDSRGPIHEIAFERSARFRRRVATPALAASDVVTIYAADGLHDGKGSWFETQFDAFTKATGVKVQYVEAGSGGVVERVAKEKSNPQADVLVTLPPFIQRAEAEGLLQKFTPDCGG